jgi:hypothetical protein
MAFDYRKLYEKKIEKIPNNWEVHHIDFDHNNNKINNLIAVPSMVHMVIHQSGFLPKDEIQNLIQIYEDNKQA